MRTWTLLLCAACSTDSFTSDAAPPDGSADGSDAASCGTFCASQQNAAFCSDFDEGSATAVWGTPDVVGAGTATPSGRLDTSDWTSCPASLLVDFPQQLTQSTGGVATEPHYIQQKSPITPTGTNGNVAVAFDVKLPSIPPPPASDASLTAGIDAISFVVLRRSSSLDAHVRIEHSGDGRWYVRVSQVNPTGTMGVEVLNPRVDAWNHMTLTVHFASDASGSVALAYDLATGTQSSVMLSALKTSDDPTQAVSLAIGAQSGTPTTGDYKFSFDSVVLTTN